MRSAKIFVPCGDEDTCYRFCACKHDVSEHSGLDLSFSADAKERGLGFGRLIVGFRGRDGLKDGT